MFKRFWLLGLTALVLIGLLVACGSNYNSSSDGLLLVGSQGSGLIETFSFSLNNGHISAIANTPNDTSNDTCVLNGLPSSLVIVPGGSYAYAIINALPSCSTGSTPSVTGIATLMVSSDGNITQQGSLLTTDTNPVSLTMDPAGKFLFVAEGTQGLVNVYAIGSSGSLTSVTPTYNFTNGPAFRTPNITAVAATPTIFPAIGVNGTQNSVCSTPGNAPPTGEFLYAVDTENYVLWEFSVDTTSGALGNPPNTTQVARVATDQVPLGVAVDPCDRFAYVSDSLTNRISGYQICSVVQQPTCPYADGSLVPTPGSPYSLSGSANGPGPIVVDPYGNDVYVVGTLSNTVSPFKIAQVSGSLTAFSPPTVATGSQPTAITIRGDDNWMFISNFNSATVSQYSIVPGSGVLTVEPVVQTDNYPWGVAVR